MKPKPFFITVIAITLLVLGSFPVVNWSVDTSRVLHEDWDRQYQERDPNFAWLTMAHYLSVSDQHDSLLMGSSRVHQGFSLKQLGGNWYKMDYPGAFAKEHLHNLELLVQKGVKPKQVWIGLDDFMVYGSRDNSKEYFYRLYPKNLLDRLDAYKFYLFKKPKKMERNILRGKEPMSDNQWVTRDRAGARMRDHFATPAEQRELLLSIPGWEADMSSRQQFNLDSVISDIIKIKELCDKNGINLKFFITPRHYKTFYARSPQHMVAFRRKLAQVTPFWDFADLNRYGLDNRYWLEASHFFPVVGDKVIARLKGEGERDFGTWITAANVEQVLAERYKTAVAKLPALAVSDTRISPDASFLDQALAIPATEMVKEKRADGSVRYWLDNAEVNRLLYLTFISEQKGELATGCGELQVIATGPINRGANQRWLAFPKACNGRPWFSLTLPRGEVQMQGMAWQTIKQPTGN